MNADIQKSIDRLMAAEEIVSCAIVYIQSDGKVTADVPANRDTYATIGALEVLKHQLLKSCTEK